MTLTTLKSKVATYLNRAVSDLTLNGIDLVVHAANDLKLQAQKTVDFELLRQAVQVTVNLSTGGSLTSAIVYGGSAAVSVNRIKSAWIVQSGTTLTRPIEVVSRDTMQKRLGRNWDLSASWHDWARSSNDTLLTLPMDCPVLVREGNTIYLWPNDGTIYGTSTTTVTVGMDVIAWAPVYTASQTFTATVTGNGPITAAAYTMTQRGIFDDYPLFKGPANNTIWVHYNTTLGAWIADTAPEAQGSYWIAATLGPEALSTTLWSGVGFTPSGALVTSAFLTTAVLDSDMFTVECNDWMFYGILRNLHYFLKDEKRTQEVHRLYGEALTATLAWNEGISDSETSDYTLD